MGLLRYIVQGFGWRVGSEIAREAIDELSEPGAREVGAREADHATPPSRRQRWSDRWHAWRHARRQRREQARAEREIDDELAALKRKAAARKRRSS